MHRKEKKYVSYLGYLGVELNKEANAKQGEEVTISNTRFKSKSHGCSYK